MNKIIPKNVHVQAAHIDDLGTMCLAASGEKLALTENAGYSACASTCH
jgi:hypothetical protein